VSPFQSCVGVPRESAVQVEPKVKWEWECCRQESDMRTIGFIHLVSQSPAPAMITGEVVLKELKNGFRVRITGEDTSIINKRG
jgi:hypothetical protein